MHTKRFEMTESGASKFWEFTIEGNTVTVRYGRLGAAGQSKRHELADEAAARKEADKLVREKTKKGYVEVTGDGAAPPSALPDASTTKAPVAAPGHPTPGRTNPVDAPSTTPRKGNLKWVLPPAGGRTWLGTDLGPHIVAEGRWGLSLRNDGVLTRVDLESGALEQLATLSLAAQPYHSLAIHPNGKDWAVSDGVTCWWNGKAIDGRLGTLCFGGDGSLWGFRDQVVVRLAPDGTLAWSGAQRGALLALSADRPVVAFYGAMLLPDASGTFQRVLSALQSQASSLVSNERFAVGFHWLQRESGWKWVASVWDLSNATERVVELVNGRGSGVLVGPRLVWPGGELDLISGEVKPFELAPVLNRQEQNDIVTLSPDGTELVQIFGEVSALRRIRLADHRETTPPPLRVARSYWSLAVAPDGRVAVGTDEGWEIFSEDGHSLHTAEVGQVVGVAFSPDGSRLAIATSDPPMVRMLDAATFAEVSRVETPTESLAFSPEGARVIVSNGKKIYLRDAESLASQAVLTTKDGARGAHFSEGRIVAHDYGGRVYVFEDPGLLPAAKKPPAFAPVLLLTNAYAYASDGHVRVECAGDSVMVSTGDKLRVFDATTKKERSAAPAKQAVSSRHGRVFTMAGASGPRLFRMGEATPFAGLPAGAECIEATVDGSRVIAAVHRGLLLWTETGGRTPATSARPFVLPDAGATAQLPGFGSDTEALVVHGFSVTTRADAARQFARVLSDEFADLVVVPEGDASETGARSGADTLVVHVGFALANAQADAEQGRKGPKVAFTSSDIERATVRMTREHARLRARIGVLQPDAVVGDVRTVVVACGPLSSAEVVVGSRKTRLSWDGAESAAVIELGPGSLVCWYD